MHKSINFDDISVSTDKSKLDINMIYDFLTNSYWAKGRRIELIKTSIQNSLCFGVYQNKEQIGFARVVTDFATFAYIADLFIVESYRGNNLSTMLINRILKHPELESIKRWLLSTVDAQGLYSKFGFTALQNPEKMMELRIENHELKIN